MAVLKDLIVHGSSRFLNKIYANQIQAESGFFNKLIAKDLQAGKATVVGLLDVQGQLHTNAWTNSNIATIDGSFYITPTISSAEGTASNISATTIQFVPRNNTFAVVSSLYYYDTSAHEGTWLKYSKVLVTGQVQLNGEWIPLGTILGYLNEDGTANSLVIAGAEDNKHRASPVLAQLVANGVTTSTSLNYRNLKVSLYQRSSSSSNNADAYKFPLGIFMTAMGTNGKTFLDIYGGGNALTTTYGGYADPNVRIGNLSGLPAVGNQTPAGWGIYTTNGYFKGTVAADNGYIGGASISNGVLTVPAANVSGELTAATINGSKITANTITASQIATNAITADELAANAVTSAKIKAGEVKATNIASSAVTADKLDATTINASNKLSVGALTTTDQNNILNSNIQIGGTNLLKNSDDLTKWSKESGLTVTWDSTVNMYKVVDTSHTSNRWGIYQDLDIKPNTTYTFSIWGMKSENTNTQSAVGTFASSLSWPSTNNSTYTTTMSHSSVTFTSGTDHVKCRVYLYLNPTADNSKTGYFYRPKLEEGNKTTDWSPAPEDIDVHKYITDIDSNKGITIKPADTSGNDYLQMNSSAINFYRNNVETLKIEDSAIRVGKLGNNLRNVYITDSAVQIRNHTTVLAEYGDSIKLYQPTTTTVAVEISSTGATFTGNVKATSLATGTKTAAETGKGTFINSNGAIYVGDGSTNNFTVTDTGTITATGANLLTATIGNATNKITIGTGTSGHSSVRYGLTTLSDTSHDGFYIGTDGIALGKGVFKVTNAGALTAKSGSIAGWSFNASSLYKTNATPGYSASTMVLSTGTASTNNIGGGGTTSKTWMISAGIGFGVTTAGTLYCNDAHISGEITATSGSIASGVTIGGKNQSQYLNNNIQIGGRNLASKANVLAYTTSYTEANYIYQGSYGAGAGLRFLSTLFTVGEDYVLSFKIKKVSGTFTFIGGHQTGFSCNEFYVDGVKSSRTWSNGQSVTNDTNTHTVNVYLTYNGNTSDNNLYIQPNRGGYTSENNSVFQFWDIKIEIGNKATAWSPAPEDLDVHKYVTDIDSNKGITIKPADTSGNDYLQINSSAINFYRNNVETLKIEDSAIRVGKLGNNLRNVYITDSAVQIRNNTTVLASFGDTITIGKSDTGHLIITDSNVTSYGKNNLEAVSFGSKNNLSTGIAQVTESLTVMGMTQGNTTYKVVYLGNEASSIVSCYKNGDTSSSISMTLMSDKRYAYNNSSLSFGDQVLITYNTVEQISYLSVGTGNFAGANSITIGQGCSSGNRSLAVGYTSEATGTNSISIGNGNKSSGLESSSFGSNNIAKGDQSTAFGSNNKSNGIDSFCAGNDNIAGGTSSVSFGSNNKSNGFDSFTTGSNNVAGDNCMATGLGTIASGSGTLTCGWYNVQDNGDLFCVGSGSSSSSRSDAFCITTSGNAILQGALYSGSRNGSVTTRKMFVVTSTTLDNQTVNASSSASFSFSVAKSGYVPIATKSVIINNASSSGTASSFCYAYYWGINDSNNFTIGIRNVASGTNAKIKIIVNVLYMANTAL